MDEPLTVDNIVLPFDDPDTTEPEHDVNIETISPTEAVSARDPSVVIGRRKGVKKKAASTGCIDNSGPLDLEDVEATSSQGRPVVCDQVMPTPAGYGDFADLEFQFEHKQHPLTVDNAATEDIPQVKPLKQKKGRRKSADFEIVNKAEVVESPEIPEDLIDMPQVPAGRRSKRLKRRSLELYRTTLQKKERLEEIKAEAFTEDNDASKSSEKTILDICDTSSVKSCESSAASTPEQMCVDVNVDVDIVSNVSMDIDKSQSEIRVSALCNTPGSTPGIELNEESVDSPDPEVARFIDSELESPIPETPESSDENNAPKKRARNTRTVTKKPDKSPPKRKPRKKQNENIEDIYLNKLWRSQLPKEKAWEAIHENPRVTTDGVEVVFGVRKAKRALLTENFHTLARLKRRRKKAMDLGWKPLSKKSQKIAEARFQEKFEQLESLLDASSGASDTHMDVESSASSIDTVSSKTEDLSVSECRACTVASPQKKTESTLTVLDTESALKHINMSQSVNNNTLNFEDQQEQSDIPEDGAGDQCTDGPLLPVRNLRGQRSTRNPATKTVNLVVKSKNPCQKLITCSPIPQPLLRPPDLSLPNPVQTNLNQFFPAVKHSLAKRMLEGVIVQSKGTNKKQKRTHDSCSPEKVSTQDSEHRGMKQRPMVEATNGVPNGGHVTSPSHTINQENIRERLTHNCNVPTISSTEEVLLFPSLVCCQNPTINQKVPSLIHFSQNILKVNGLPVPQIIRLNRITFLPGSQGSISTPKGDYLIQVERQGTPLPTFNPDIPTLAQLAQQKLARRLVTRIRDQMECHNQPIPASTTLQITAMDQNQQNVCLQHVPQRVTKNQSILPVIPKSRPNLHLSFEESKVSVRALDSLREVHTEQEQVPETQQYAVPHMPVSHQSNLKQAQIKKDGYRLNSIASPVFRLTEDHHSICNISQASKQTQDQAGDLRLDQARLPAFKQPLDQTVSPLQAPKVKPPQTINEGQHQILTKLQPIDQRDLGIDDIPAHCSNNPTPALDCEINSEAQNEFFESNTGELCFSEQFLSNEKTLDACPSTDSQSQVMNVSTLVRTLPYLSAIEQATAIPIVEKLNEGALPNSVNSNNFQMLAPSSFCSVENISGDTDKHSFEVTFTDAESENTSSTDLMKICGEGDFSFSKIKTVFKTPPINDSTNENETGSTCYNDGVSESVHDENNCEYSPVLPIYNQQQSAQGENSTDTDIKSKAIDGNSSSSVTKSGISIPQSDTSANINIKSKLMDDSDANLLEELSVEQIKSRDEGNVGDINTIELGGQYQTYRDQDLSSNNEDDDSQVSSEEVASTASWESEVASEEASAIGAIAQYLQNGACDCMGYYKNNENGHNTVEDRDLEYQNIEEYISPVSAASQSKITSSVPDQGAYANEIAETCQNNKLPNIAEIFKFSSPVRFMQNGPNGFKEPWSDNTYDIDNCKQVDSLKHKDIQFYGIDEITDCNKEVNPKQIPLDLISSDKPKDSSSTILTEHTKLPSISDIFKFKSPVRFTQQETTELPHVINHANIPSSTFCAHPPIRAIGHDYYRKRTGEKTSNTRIIPDSLPTGLSSDDLGVCFTSQGHCIYRVPHEKRTAVKSKYF